MGGFSISIGDYWVSIGESKKTTIFKKQALEKNSKNGQKHSDA
ncbi:hypothetical protein [Neobacillus sp. NPDC093127]